VSERDGYKPGVPCWVDTWQPDPDGAVGFYTQLFGRHVARVGHARVGRERRGHRRTGRRRSRNAVLADPDGAVFSVSKVAT
jgi:hypothetical protein